MTRPLYPGGQQNTGAGWAPDRACIFLGKKNKSCDSYKIKTNIPRVFKAVKLTKLISIVRFRVPWTGSQEVTQKHLYLISKQHGVKNQKVVIFIFKAIETPDVTGFRTGSNGDVRWAVLNENFATLFKTQSKFVLPPRNTWNVYRKKNKGFSKWGRFFRQAFLTW